MPDPNRPRIGARRLVGGEGEPEVFCADEQDDVPIDLPRWQTLAAGVLRAEGVHGLCELSVIFVSETDITELNESYMGSSKATDVLAFPIDAGEVEVVSLGHSPSSRGPDRAPADPSDMPLLLGDVVICPTVALRQAADHAGTLDDELALLLVHGVLHVLGHDHAAQDDTDRIRARERTLLEELHWGGPAPAAFRQEHSS